MTERKKVRKKVNHQRQVNGQFGIFREWRWNCGEIGRVGGRDRKWKQKFWAEWKVYKWNQNESILSKEEAEKYFYQKSRLAHESSWWYLPWKGIWFFFSLLLFAPPFTISLLELWTFVQFETITNFSSSFELIKNTKRKRKKLPRTFLFPFHLHLFIHHHLIAILYLSSSSSSWLFFQSIWTILILMIDWNWTRKTKNVSVIGVEK